MVHFNIGQRVEVNPFEKVNFLDLSTYACSTGIENLRKFLNKEAVEVTTRKINGEFKILFNVELLDFTTLLQWFAPYRGKFYMGNHSIHFMIEGDIMSCW